jgi:hypothetical protein
MASAAILLLVLIVWWWSVEADAPPGRQLSKVIYMGFPMRLDETTDPPTVSGFFRFVPALYFNGAFVAYEGSYWSALKHWFSGPTDGDGPDAFV